MSLSEISLALMLAVGMVNTFFTVLSVIDRGFLGWPGKPKKEQLIRVHTDHKSAPFQI